MVPPQTLQEDEEISELIASNTDAMATSEGQMLCLPNSKECIQANLTVDVFQDPTFTDSMTNFETFIGGLGFPLDFISSPFSLNMYSDLTTGAGIPPLEPGTFGNDNQSTAGPLPFSRDLYPHDMMQSRKPSISVGSKSFKRSSIIFKHAIT